MEKENSTGVSSSAGKLNVDDLGAIPNLTDRLDVQKVLAKHSTWLEALLEVYDSKLYIRISGNVIARLLLLTKIEELQNVNRTVQASERKTTFPTRSGARYTGL
jgi:hypothetical protein